MKRKGEIVLGIIGVVISAIMILLGIFAMSLKNNDEVKQAIQKSASNDPSISSGDVNQALDAMSSGGGVLIVAAVLGLIVGLIAVFCVKGNKKPKMAGILFIVAAILIGVISLGSGFLPAILYLIAGIMCLVRKPQVFKEM